MKKLITKKEIASKVNVERKGFSDYFFSYQAKYELGGAQYFGDNRSYEISVDCKRIFIKPYSGTNGITKKDFINAIYADLNK